MKALLTQHINPGSAESEADRQRGKPKNSEWNAKVSEYLTGPNIRQYFCCGFFVAVRFKNEDYLLPGVIVPQGNFNKTHLIKCFLSSKSLFAKTAVGKSWVISKSGQYSTRYQMIYRWRDGMTEKRRISSSQAFLLSKSRFNKLLKQTETGDTRYHSVSHARPRAFNEQLLSLALWM